MIFALAFIVALIVFIPLAEPSGEFGISIIVSAFIAFGVNGAAALLSDFLKLFN